MYSQKSGYDRDVKIGLVQSLQNKIDGHNSAVSRGEFESKYGDMQLNLGTIDIDAVSISDLEKLHNHFDKIIATNYIPVERTP